MGTCNITNLCNALLSYYNTSIFSRPDMDDIFKEACYAQAKICADIPARKDKSLERTVLKQLILSHQNQENPSTNKKTKKPFAKFIAGPFSLTLQWSAKYKKLIYIFGEEHLGKPDCPEKSDGTITIQDYMFQLYQNGDCFMDFYIETGSHFKNKKPFYVNLTYMLGLLRHKFKTCLEKGISNPAKCRKGRVHYIDIRQIEGEGIEYFNINNYIFEYRLISYIDDKEYYLKSLTDFLSNVKVSTTIKEISQMTPEEFMQYAKSEFEANYLFNKELRKSKIKQEINTFIDETITNYRDIIIQIIDGVQELIIILDNYKDIVDDTKYNFEYLISEDLDNSAFKILFDILHNKIYENLELINALLVDGYLLGRVFKDFNIDVKDKKKKRNTDEPYDSHNIVIYAGNTHSDVYRTFLDEKLGFELIAWTGQDWRTKDKSHYNNCIDMAFFPQPFFDYHRKVDWLTVTTNIPVKSAIRKKKPKPPSVWKKTQSRTDPSRIYYFKQDEKKVQNERPPEYYSSEDDMDGS